MPALERKVIVNTGNCGTSVTKKHLSRHMSSCSGGTWFCPKWPKFPAKSRDDLNYHFAKKHSVPRPSITYNCKLCHAEFRGFYALRQHKNTQHGTQIGFAASKSDVEDKVWEGDDQSLREELESCKQFLTDTEMEHGRRRVFNFVMSSFDMSLPNDELDYVLKELKYAAKVSLHLDSFWRTLRMESVDTFMLTWTIRLWRGRNKCVHQTKLPTWKRNYRKWILVIFVQEKEREREREREKERERERERERELIPNGSFTNSQIWQFLQCDSKMYPWVVKIQSYLKHFWEIVMWIALLLREIPYNLKMTISICLEP